MPPSRPTARCCRVVQQQIRAPLENIWITEGMLASAFERYCHVSRINRRKSSSVPGPLENRRRLGKRKMTDLHMNPQPMLPPWAMDFLPDLSQWAWQPPTPQSSEENRARRSQQSQLGPWRVMRWWTNKVEPKEEESDTTEVGSQPEIEFYNRLAKARAAVAASTSNVSGPAYFNFIEGLQHDLKLGILDPEVVSMAVSTFPSSLISTGVDGEVVNASIEMFLSAVVNGIVSSEVLGPSEFDASLWNLVLCQMSQLPANDATTLLFQTTLDAIPLHYVNDAHGGIIAAVQTLAVCRSPEVGRAAHIGAALHRLSPVDHGALLDGMETAIYEGSTAFEEEPRQKLRFLWLQILAHMPHVDTDYFLDACVRSAYFDREALSLVGRDLSRLLIQQWASRGYLRRHKEVEAAWNRDSSSHAELNFASLAIHTCCLGRKGFRDGPRVLLMMSLFKALRRLGLEKELMASLQRYCEAMEKLQVTPFKHLAMASRNHRTALEIFLLLETHATKLNEPLELRWNWTAWTSYVESMIRDTSISLALIWKVADSNFKRAFGSPVHHELLTRRRIRMMEDMALWFSQAHHLTDAKALRQVCRCIGWLRGHNIELSHKPLRAVLAVVTREFKRGELGRTRRMSWLMRLVEQYQGPSERRAVAEALQRWRRGNKDLYAVSKRQADEQDPS
ncbi:hypothetical protein CSUB01_03525 [Colletotrichum sublineola]|uniref:Uncharacterized protein n=1 Tax=Colletotrichum sublineola TaxID=1173701 RepID=A0A066X8F5_COLSU|nr:hypothetical protein CSUB01_03525 [Colletotrichum sublineola]